ncbi:hypothetical protein PTSG_12056 [Salpingoeca rosetta]|uniref:DNA mismatch repair proteins mutS family domain-containing protein n=1 Tax=Salpingoeca rosetta (strain ATCC 50818 / BSB-021) TaxID=946362 RepID=F2U687_SALR5|nr:uncharacterized protein PTSG_12056 [Salpingoeca rosetta]EGD83028.1 hypothetical protein PTSG_12056 [Salpingoeca rosetta]|eukprot:XP_004995392.1 hypothetical protein PTSG_12056 [Salpingoeca rosetta]
MQQSARCAGARLWHTLHCSRGQLAAATTACCHHNSHTATLRWSSSWASTQYSDLKRKVPDHILLMEVGNFYELYLEDAILVNSKLPLALSKKGMAGFPIHRKDAWIPQLQALFSAVAVADQCDPGVSATLKRQIARIYTPGTLLPEIDVEDDSPRHLTAIVADNLFAPAKFGLCVFNNITGQLHFDEMAPADLLTTLPGLDTVELLLINPDLRDDVCRILSKRGIAQSPSVPLTNSLHRLRCFNDTFVMGVPENWLARNTGDLPLPLSDLQRAAGNVVTNYLRRCYPKGLPTLLLPHQSGTNSQSTDANVSAASPQPSSPSSSFDVHVEDDVSALPPIDKEQLVIDADTRESLNLTVPRGKGSLLHVVDNTVSAFGRRELRSRLANPITDRHEIERRLDLVEYFYDNHEHGAALQRLLSACADPLRCLSSLSARATLSNTTVNLAKLAEFCTRVEMIVSSPNLAPDVSSVGGEQLAAALEDLHHFTKAVPRELFESANSSSAESDDDDDAETSVFPAPGFDATVDEQREIVSAILREAQKHAADISLDARLTEPMEGVLAMQIKPKLAAELKKSVRGFSLLKRGLYDTPRLQSLSLKLGHARRELTDAQMECARRVCGVLIANSHLFEKASRVLAHLDVCAGLARTATLREYVRPTITDGVDFNVVQGRHAILDALTAGDALHHFRPNDCVMDEHKSVIITGPNMGGKSTFLRQNALLVVLAQMGSFVPAEECTIGIVDKLFSRVGAQDNQVEGKSTFLVEMEETSNIVNNATARSFVVMDEVGRGTNSGEGLALAVAISHELAKSGCRSLSVTHHLQLPALCQDLDNVGVYKFVAEKDDDGRILFHHSIKPGIADDAHAIEVAAFAGHPPAVTDMAAIVLRSLQQQNFGHVDAAPIKAAMSNARR